MSGELSIVWAPLLPWSLLAGTAALSALVIAFMVMRRARGALLRGVFLALLLAVLANPSVRQEERETLSDIVIVISDESESQEIGARPDQNRAAIAHLRDELERLSDTEVRLIRAGGGASGLDGRGTRLFSALGRALSEVPRNRVAGVLMVSDGQVHDLPEDWASLGLDAPLHLLLTGEAGERDRRLVVGANPSETPCPRSLRS